MVTVLTPQQLNRTFKLRMGLLGKSAFPVSADSDEPPQIILPDLPGKPQPLGDKKTRQYTVDEQEYTALYSEGSALYQRNEYARAIEAFSKANDINVDQPNPNILIDRADCYIHIGHPELALEDVNKVLSENKNNPRAILTKAEAYFSMGEFEFALVFYQRGLNIRKDMSGFKDGIAKSRHAILDAIRGENVFQPNPNYATSRPRKPLVETRSLPPQETDEPKEETKPQKDPTKLLPEKVPPLASTDEGENYLGELTLDYQFLEELQSELNDPDLNTEKDGEKEDAEIKKIVSGALDYLKQRGAFWSQQGKKAPAPTEKTSGNATNRSATKSPSASQSLKKSTKTKRDATVSKSQKPHYEMSKLQQYESKYPSKKNEEQ